MNKDIKERIFLRNKEIERKFLVNVDDIPYNLKDYNYDDIVQGYITSIDKTFSFRVRQSLKIKDGAKIDEKYTQTIKSKGGMVRDEYEIELNREQFTTLWKLCNNISIHKFRYNLEYNEHIIELDIYKNSLDGLYIVEVEFEDLETCNNFKIPSWFGEEVTEIRDYKNLELALKIHKDYEIKKNS